MEIFDQLLAMLLLVLLLLMYTVWKGVASCGIGIYVISNRSTNERKSSSLAYHFCKGRYSTLIPGACRILKRVTPHHNAPHISRKCTN